MWTSLAPRFTTVRAPSSAGGGGDRLVPRSRVHLSDRGPAIRHLSTARVADIHTAVLLLSSGAGARLLAHRSARWRLPSKVKKHEQGVDDSSRGGRTRCRMGKGTLRTAGATARRRCPGEKSGYHDTAQHTPRTSTPVVRASPFRHRKIQDHERTSPRGRPQLAAFSLIQHTTALTRPPTTKRRRRYARAHLYPTPPAHPPCTHPFLSPLPLFPPSPPSRVAYF
jgi:hypothetical protein